MRITNDASIKKVQYSPGLKNTHKTLDQLAQVESIRGILRPKLDSPVHMRFISDNKISLEGNRRNN